VIFFYYNHLKTVVFILIHDISYCMIAASEKDMYWAYGQELLSLKLEEFFCCIENILGFSRSPPLTGWVGSRHTGKAWYLFPLRLCS
jgi:hypothetical protein